MTDFKLHYIGSRVYSPERFMREAARLGVNRGLPSSYVRGLAYGEAVLLGTWTSPKGTDGKPLRAPSEDKPEKSVAVKQGGTAHVFGYFRVGSLHVEAIPEVRAYLYDHLRIVEVDESPPQEVERECGSYTLGPAVYVENTVAEIAAIVQEAEEAYHTRARIFVAGPFHDLTPGVELSPAAFTRTLLNVAMGDGFNLGGLEARPKALGRDVTPVRFVMDYALRRYVPKAERERQLGDVAKDVVP